MNLRLLVGIVALTVVVAYAAQPSTYSIGSVIRLVSASVNDVQPLMLNDIPQPVVEALLVSQLGVESNFLPYAVSRRGAMGIAQFMSDTWQEWGRGDPFNPRDAIPAQVAYMSYLYGRLGEIPDPIERYKFALAAYVSGIGNVNRTLAVARQKEGFPSGYSEWVAAGSPRGQWQEWSFAKQHLSDVISVSNSTVVIRYVDRIINRTIVMLGEGR